MAAHQAPLSLGFSRQEYQSGLSFPSPVHVCMLSRFSLVRLCVTLWTAAHQAPPRDSLGKNTGVGFHFRLHSWPYSIFQIHVCFFPQERLLWIVSNFSLVILHWLQFSQVVILNSLPKWLSLRRCLADVLLKTHGQSSVFLHTQHVTSTQNTRPLCPPWRSFLTWISGPCRWVVSFAFLKAVFSSCLLSPLHPSVFTQVYLRSQSYFFLHIVVFVQSLSPVFRLLWVFIAARGLSLVAGTGFSLWWRLLLWKRKCGTWASGVVAHGLSSCCAWAYLPRSLWDLPGPGIKPTSPTLTGGLFTGPPREVKNQSLNLSLILSTLPHMVILSNPMP